MIGRQRSRDPGRLQRQPLTLGLTLTLTLTLTLSLILILRPEALTLDPACGFLA